MASIIRQWRFGVPARQCWDAVRDFGAVHERLAAGFVTNSVLVGDGLREVTFFTGAVAREQLVGVDDEAMRLAYTVVSGPLGSTHYNAAVQVVPDGERACMFVWIVDLLPDELAEPVAALMQAGLTAMRATVEGTMPRPADAIAGSAG